MLDGFHKSDELYYQYALPDGRQIPMRYDIMDPPGRVRGTAPVLTGRGGFIRKYKNLTDELLNRGLRVIVPEWINYGGSARWLSDPAKRQIDYIPDFDIHLRSFSAFHREVIQPNQIGPLIPVAHSLGGHMLTRWMAEQTEKQLAKNVQAAVLLAPMFAFTIYPLRDIVKHWIKSAAHVGHRQRLPRRMEAPRYLKTLARAHVQAGYGECFAWGEHPYDERDRTFHGNKLTRNRDHFDWMNDYLMANPRLIVGGASWGWVDAANRSIDRTHQDGYLERVNREMLCVTGAHDMITPHHIIKPYIDRLSNVQDVVIQDCLHDMPGEKKEIRARAWSETIGPFIERHLPRAFGKVAAL